MSIDVFDSILFLVEVGYLEFDDAFSIETGLELTRIAEPVR